MINLFIRYYSILSPFWHIPHQKSSFPTITIHHQQQTDTELSFRQPTTRPSSYHSSYSFCVTFLENGPFLIVGKMGDFQVNLFKDKNTRWNNNHKNNIFSIYLLLTLFLLLQNIPVSYFGHMIDTLQKESSFRGTKHNNPHNNRHHTKDINIEKEEEEEEEEGKVEEGVEEKEERQRRERLERREKTGQEEYQAAFNKLIDGVVETLNKKKNRDEREAYEKRIRYLRNRREEHLENNNDEEDNNNDEEEFFSFWNEHQKTPKERELERERERERALERREEEERIAERELIIEKDKKIVLSSLSSLVSVNGGVIEALWFHSLYGGLRYDSFFFLFS